MANTSLIRNLAGLGLTGLLITVITGCDLSNSDVVVPLTTVPQYPIAYIHNDQLWLAGSDGLNQRSLLNTAGSYFSPVWFPNRTTLLYGVQSGEYYELWMQDIPSGTPDFLLATRNQPHDISISPNNQYVMYFENDTVYVFAIETGIGTRIHEGARSASWSPDSKSIVFNTVDDRLIVQNFTLTQELDDPIVLSSGHIVSPLFLTPDTIIYEGMLEDAYTLIELDLQTVQTRPLTSLRFTEPSTQIILRLEPNGNRLLYVRPDEVTLLPNVWLVHVEKDLPKLILTNVSTPIWSESGDMILYVGSGIDSASQAIPVVYTATSAGLQKTPIIENGHSVVSTGQFSSNTYSL